MKIVVIGACHAGVEAALASARMGIETILLTMDPTKIAVMPCNPSIGGPAKGIVVREIDALGGQMGITADHTALQFKLLNTNKGPGVQCLRVQSDKIAYSRMMGEIVHHTPNLTVKSAMVEAIRADNGIAKGVRLKDEGDLLADAVILTSGTYMSSKVLVGSSATSSGPDGNPTTNTLSASLRDLGLKTFRLKTGTPPRILTSSIDFTQGVIQPGDPDFLHFSLDFPKDKYPTNQEPCYLIYTQPQTHQVIQLNLKKSAMYSGLVEGVGPRYCPSIEDKLVRFADKDRHQIFLEPESRELETTYIQGFSTSMPHDVQEQMIRSLPGFKDCVIVKYAYAIEYDAIDPTQLKPSLELKAVENLFCAGQINGTSGYEEAAGQGLMAGINASLKVKGQEPLILGRDEAYIGVMIDDLVTKGVTEPYRLLTSRAEYRLLLRHDNAEARLSEKGYAVGLLPQARIDKVRAMQAQKAQLLGVLESTRFTKKHAIRSLLEKGGEMTEGISALGALKRPEITMNDLAPYVDLSAYETDVLRRVEIEIKYDGYIQKAQKEAQRHRQLENTVIDPNLDYAQIPHLAIEARQKLSAIRPRTVGQASRISGVNPADLSVLITYLSTQSAKSPKATSR
jgi:tRNA uridine 5-carboxymethylaminomethyl modification enzyme